MKLSTKLYDTIKQKKQNGESFSSDELRTLIYCYYEPLWKYFGKADRVRVDPQGNRKYCWSADKVAQGVARYTANRRTKMYLKRRVQKNNKP